MKNIVSVVLFIALLLGFVYSMMYAWDNEVKDVRIVDDTKYKPYTYHGHAEPLTGGQNYNREGWREQQGLPQNNPYRENGTRKQWFEE